MRTEQWRQRLPFQMYGRWCFFCAVEFGTNSVVCGEIVFGLRGGAARNESTGYKRDKLERVFWKRTRSLHDDITL